VNESEDSLAWQKVSRTSISQVNTSGHLDGISPVNASSEYLECVAYKLDKTGLGIRQIGGCPETCGVNYLI